MGIMSDEATGEVRRFVAFLFDVAVSVSDDCRKRRVLAGDDDRHSIVQPSERRHRGRASLMNSP